MRAILLITVAALSGCNVAPESTAEDRQAQATKAMTNEADRQVGMPAITNFAERKLMKDVYERRDRAGNATFAYTQGLDGRLVCLGNAVGYGLPYGAQFTAPYVIDYLYQGGSAEVPQAEPNGLYMPDSASATWLQMVNPATGKVDVVYVEPTIVVSPFRLKGGMVAVDCPA